MLEGIQPEGFNWTDITDSEMAKFEAIFKAGMQETLDWIRAHGFLIVYGKYSDVGRKQNALFRNFLKEEGIK